MPFSAKQIFSFNDCDARINIWCGAVRSGKSFTADLKFIDFLKNGVAGDVMIIGVNRDTIQRNVLRPMYRILGFPEPGSKTVEVKLFKRNVYFVGAHDEGAVRRIQGATLAYAYVDEATCIPAPFWRMLLSRLSITGAKLIATCNPEAPAHWLKKEYIDRANQLDLKFWNFQLDDNPTLDPKYVDALKREFTGMWYKRYILGEWAVAHGIIYDRFDFDNIYDRQLESPNYYIIGIDYGTSNATAAVLISVKPNQWPQIRVEKEYYYDSHKEGRSKINSELADDIKEFIGWRSIRAVYVDPSAASLKQELRNRDLPVVDAKNDVLEGIKVTSKFIAGKNLVIHAGCKNLIEHIQGYSWCPKAADRGEDKPLKDKDHLCDALRYAVYSAFPLGELSHADDNITVEQLRRQIYGDQTSMFAPNTAGYF